MKPEWSGNPELGQFLIVYGLTGLIAFLLLVYVFAFYF
jgi:hypothetical protein